jgi:hypothetical protein
MRCTGNGRVIEKYRFYWFCWQKMWKSDKNNINIGPDVRLKKNAMFKFHTDAKTGVKSSEQKIMKSAKPIGSGYF